MKKNTKIIFCLAVPQTHQTPLKTTENTHTPEVFHNNEEEITSSTLEQAQQVNYYYYKNLIIQECN